MNDFIYSNNQNDKDSIEKELRSRNYFNKEIKTVCGSFGTISYIASPYRGYGAIETDDYLFLTLGGPLLKFCPNDYFNDENNISAAQRVFNKWIIDKSFDFVNDIDSPFLFLYLDKAHSAIKIVTDLLLFIPFYYCNKSSHLYISSIIGKEMGFDLDMTSVADFLSYGFITFPYTSYKDIYQAKPATEYEIDLKSLIIKENTYWKPYENYNFDFAANVNFLREAYNDFFKRLQEYKPKISAFLSGGEDSRLVASSIPAGTDTYTMIDYENRESSIARKVARELKMNHIVYYRSEDYYLKQLNEVVSVIGLTGEFVHCHMYTMAKEIDFCNYDVIIDGLQSDTYLKGYYMGKAKSSKLLNFLPIKDKKLNDYKPRKVSSIHFESNIIKEMNERRQQYLLSLKEIRPESYKEWSLFWPSTHDELSTYTINRRIIPVFCPFMSNDIITISKDIPQEYKLNRLVFQKAFKSNFEMTKDIPHHDGFYPNEVWWKNRIDILIESIKRNIMIRIQKKDMYTGSWRDWNTIMKSDEFNDVLKRILTFLSDSKYIDRGRFPQIAELNSFDKRRLLQLSTFVNL